MTSTTDQFAFADEYGDPNTETTIAGVSSHFIVSAVLVSPESIDEARSQAEHIRNRHFQTGEMKSSKVGDDDERRARIISDMQSIPFRFRALIVDKRGLSSTGGLIYKQPFLKYISSRLYRILYRIFPNLYLVADEHGSRQFMNGFVQYVHNNHKPDLFSKATFEFRSSKGEPLLQIADMISGTLARYFDPKKVSSRGQEFIGLLCNQSLGIESWPPLSFGMMDQIPTSSTHDDAIRAYALRQAVLFIHEHQANPNYNEAEEHQLEVIKYLLFHFQCLGENDYVSTDFLIDILSDLGLPTISKQILRTKVIAKLRDAGVVIASSTNGYKIPSGHRDLNEFVQMANGMIGPMLHRLKLARTAIRTATHGQLDILGDSSVAYLAKMADELPSGAWSETVDDS